MHSVPRFTICAMILLGSACAWMPTPASAVTLSWSYEYSGTGTVGFGSDATLNIGGVCSSQCVIGIGIAITNGSGAPWDPSIPSGWDVTASARITDNLGDNVFVGNVFTGDYTSGTHHPVFGTFFTASALPSVLDISTSSIGQF